MEWVLLRSQRKELVGKIEFKSSPKTSKVGINFAFLESIIEGNKINPKTYVVNHAYKREG